MDIQIKDTYKDIQVGDFIVTLDNRVRMITNVRRKYYGALNPDTGEIIFEHNTIEELLEEYDIARIIKNKDMKLIEV